MERADDPILQALHVQRNVAVEAWAAERRYACLVLDESVDGLPAELADLVDRGLKAEPAELHEDDDHLELVVGSVSNV